MDQRSLAPVGTGEQFVIQAYSRVCQAAPTQSVMPHAELMFDRFITDIISFMDGTSATAQERSGVSVIPSRPRR